MPVVEKIYNQLLNRMSGRERIERTCSLFNAMKEMLEIKITKEFKEIDQRQMQKKIAEKLYSSDKNIQKLISRLD